ncbi:hypothetical protein RHGRI_000340 [Rhododendron griersonianum]|uniref:Uncharacterized protein n=1 Tax=Rhododendron griersonianum TaxID=479676 RepID=A0AAV6LH80_9ERIC|nr:hypothetical protein RHGRI_000340 [Rhododendron griersonianum]
MMLLFNHPLASIFLGVIKFLTWLKVDLVFTILNVMCEGVSAALEQVAGNRLAYISGGFGCTVVAIRFAVRELLWMKKMKLHIGILDLLPFSQHFHRFYLLVYNLYLLVFTNHL